MTLKTIKSFSRASEVGKMGAGCPRYYLKYTRQDVADVCGVSLKTLWRWCKRDRIRLESLSLKELVDFINQNQKGERHGQCTTSKTNSM